MAEIGDTMKKFNKPGSDWGRLASAHVGCEHFQQAKPTVPEPACSNGGSVRHFGQKLYLRSFSVLWASNTCFENDKCQSTHQIM
jgi:hypothetical protein